MTSKMIALAAAVMALASGGATQAGFVVNVTESGGNLVAIGRGTINTTGLSSPRTGGGGRAALISAPIGSESVQASFGPAPGNSTTAFLYQGISGPVGFGPGPMPGVPLGATSGGGDLVGISVDSSNRITLITPENYVSGTLLNNSDTWAGGSFRSFGMTPGTYVWTWGSGANADSFTMNIGTASAVPEPSSLVLMGIGGIATLGCTWRRRRTKVVG